MEQTYHMNPLKTFSWWNNFFCLFIYAWEIFSRSSFLLCETVAIISGSMLYASTITMPHLTQTDMSFSSCSRFSIENKIMSLEKLVTDDLQKLSKKLLKNHSGMELLFILRTSRNYLSFHFRMRIKKVTGSMYTTTFRFAYQ